jgi:dihydroorotate dehydrogenase
MIYKIFIRPILFLLNPESAHDLIFNIISRLKFFYPLFKFLYSPKEVWDEIEIKGLKFRNRVGIAAGLDKDGIAIRFFDAIGFSHIEVGTVTPLPQPGNPKPRLFRLVKDKALINRMGFNNSGADIIRENILKARKKISSDFLIGVNIGKNKDTQIENASEDYKICIEKLFDVADFFTVNISSPNTENLRILQTDEYLDSLLDVITLTNIEQAEKYSVLPKNIFLKIAPDLTNEEIEHIFLLVAKYDLCGIVATNTTITRYDLISDLDETGGLSGRPLKDISGIILDKLHSMNLNNPYAKLYLIGSGGIFTKEDYKEKLIAGADLVQIYTGYIYEGNAILKKLLK